MAEIRGDLAVAAPYKATDIIADVYISLLNPYLCLECNASESV